MGQREGEFDMFKARRTAALWLAAAAFAATSSSDPASALMLGSGPRVRTEQFVRVGGGMYWRFDEATVVPHGYVYVGNNGTPLVSDPAATSWDADRTDVFVINQNQTVDHGGMAAGQSDFRWWDNWGSPSPGRPLVGISAVSGRSGLLDVFVTDASLYNGTNNLYHRRWDNGWDTGWQTLVASGTNGLPAFFGGPGAVAGGSNGPDSYDVFVRGKNPSTGRWNIYHVMSPNGVNLYAADNLFEPGGAALNSDPHAASWSNGRMDVVVSDTAGAIRHIYTGGCSAHTPFVCTSYYWYWNTWGSPAVGSAPNIVAYGPNNLHVYARQASDSSLLDCRWENADYGCSNQGGSFNGGPGASSRSAPYCSGGDLCYLPDLERVFKKDGIYAAVSLDQIRSFVPQITDPYRRSIVDWATYQLYEYNPQGVLYAGDGTVGACGNPARDIYGATHNIFFTAEWCTEFARRVLQWAGMKNVGDLWDAVEVADMKNVFQPWGAWIDHNQINAGSLWYGAEPGDYFTMIGSSGDHYGHSMLVVGVALDNSTIWTVEGNVDDCVRFQHRDYVTNGQLNSDLDAIGKVNILY
jgi:hypothetical protein